MSDNLRVSWFTPGALERKSILRGLLAVRQYARGVMLDVGCWKKPYGPIFAPFVTKHIGVDLPGRTIGSTADIFANAYYLPFCDGSIDTILCTQVLDDVPEPKQLFLSFQRVLRQGGYLILTAPFIFRLHDEPHDYYRFTEYGLRHLASETGFTVERINLRGGAWTAIGQMVSLQLWSSLGKGKIGSWLTGLPCALIQMGSAFFDRMFYNQNMTLGYIIVASKE